MVRDFAAWLETTGISVKVQSISWIIPVLQSIHILMIGIVFVSSLMITLRVVGGIRTDEPFATVWGRFAPWMWSGLVVMALSGLVLIIGEPRRSLLNSTFYLKMALLAVAIMLTAGLQRSISSSPDSWDKDRRRRLAARFAATASIAVWCGILFAGRWIAYTQAG